MTDTDRRQYERYSPEGQAIAAFRSEDGRIVVGSIRNISAGGLFFQYTDVGIPGEMGQGTVDVYFSEKDFFLPDIPCQVVYSIEIVENDYLIDIPLPKMCCGLKFVELVEETSESLNYLINVFAADK